jgi:hypothetical protein
MKIRVACAWALVVLAASPVTAPFCPCDLLDLLARHAARTSAAVSAAVAIAPSAVRLADDSGSALPLLTSREPPTECRDGSVMFPFSGVSVVVRDVNRPRSLTRSVRSRPALPTVLRV